MLLRLCLGASTSGFRTRLKLAAIFHPGLWLNDAQIELSKIARKNFALSLKRCSKKIFRHRKVAQKTRREKSAKNFAALAKHETLLRIRSGFFAAAKLRTATCAAGPGQRCPPCPNNAKRIFGHGKRRQFFARSAKTDAAEKPAQCQQRQGFQPSQRKMTQRKAASKAHAM